MGFNWGNAAGGAASGASAGSAFGPWGTAIGAGVGGIAGGFFGDDAGGAAQNAENAGWDQSQGYQRPFWQGGVDQYGRLNDATGKLMNPAALQDEWSKNYETSPYAKQMLQQNQASGLDAASSMGLMGSSAAIGNIQQGAHNVVNQDRQQYMNDLMQKYMAGIGLGSNMYGIGAQAGANLGQGAMTHGENQADIQFNRINNRNKDITRGIGSAINSFGGGGNQFNSSNMPTYAQNALYG